MTRPSGQVGILWAHTGCRIHGPVCRIPWGYNEAHTDSDRPYTLDELAARPDSPHRYAYPTVAEYEQGWYLWRALRRDDRPSPAEAEVAHQLRIWHVVERAAAERGCDPAELAESWGIETAR